MLPCRSNSTSFFSNCTKIKSITLPNTVTAIESYAFYDCSFSNIYIPNSVKTIGNYAFYSCDNLTSIDLDSVETIGVNAFANNNLTTINLKNIHTIGNYAFAYSNNLNEIYIDGKNIFNNLDKKYVKLRQLQMKNKLQR